MNIFKDKIVEATELELYDYYVTREYYDVYTFPDFIYQMEKAGTVVTEKEE